MSKLVLLIGAPGSGKGTQAKLLCQFNESIHLSTGDILRKEVECKSSLGLTVKELIENGQLVSDEIVHKIVVKTLDVLRNKKIIYLDGYPRTLIQYQMLENYLKQTKQSIFKTIYFELDKSEVIERISGRLTCPKTGKIYHKLYNPPPDNIINTLSSRDDDSEEKAAKRFDIFIKETQPILDCLKNSLHNIDASLPIEQISNSLNLILNDTL